MVGQSRARVTVASRARAQRLFHANAYVSVRNECICCCGFISAHADLCHCWISASGNSSLWRGEKGLCACWSFIPVCELLSAKPSQSTAVPTSSKTRAAVSSESLSNNEFAVKVY